VTPEHLPDLVDRERHRLSGFRKSGTRTLKSPLPGHHSALKKISDLDQVGRLLGRLVGNLEAHAPRMNSPEEAPMRLLVTPDGESSSGPTTGGNSTFPRPAERPTLTVEEAAKLLGISRGSAYEAARVGDLPVLRIGRRYLVSTARLAAMVGLDFDEGPAA
jgi:excisionase family DNA binding protein